MNNKVDDDNADDKPYEQNKKKLRKKNKKKTKSNLVGDNDNNSIKKLKKQDGDGDVVSATTATTSSRASADKDAKKKIKSKKRARVETSSSNNHVTIAAANTEDSSHCPGNPTNTTRVLNDKDVVEELSTEASAHRKRRKKNTTKKMKKLNEELCNKDISKESVEDVKTGTVLPTEEDVVADFPFDAEPDDHCESPLEAYEDIVPILQACARRLKKSQQELSIYDPYYCDNRVARNMASLGFPTVYNRKEDCYKVWDDPSRYPPNDIVVTNPPYSGDHIEKLIRHVAEHQSQRSKPFALLLPVFVHKKDFFEAIIKNPKRGRSCSPIFLVPQKRYVYQPPPNFRAKKVSDTHKKSSPFPSMWYLWGGSQEATDEWFRILQKQGDSTSRFSVARSKSALRDLRRKHKK